MNLLKLSFKNLLAKPLSFSLSLLMLAFGLGMILMLLQINHQIESKFKNNIRGIDLVVGAKGSPLQLVLSSVYHIDKPTGNIDWNKAKKILKNPLVKKTIPLSYGDNYRSFRIVGTNENYLKHYDAKFKKGKTWQNSMEVVLGQKVAQELGIKLNETFLSHHGLDESGHEHDEKPYKVVGILEKTNSVLDQLILTNLESIWETHDLEFTTSTTLSTRVDDLRLKNKDSLLTEKQTNPKPLTLNPKPLIPKEITALLVQYRNPMGHLRIPKKINQKSNLQAAAPAIEINRLFDLMGFGFTFLKALASILILISGLSIFIALLNVLKERKYELALMRVMGASSFKIFMMILLEALLLILLAFGLAFILARLGLFAFAYLSENNFHYGFEAFTLLKSEIILFLLTLGIGILVGTIPAWMALKVNISKTLKKG